VLENRSLHRLVVNTCADAWKSLKNIYLKLVKLLVTTFFS